MNPDSFGVPTRREPLFRTSDYCDGFCFCTFTQHTQLILRHQLHIAYYNETYNLRHEHAQLLCATWGGHHLWRHRHGSFCRKHHWSPKSAKSCKSRCERAYFWPEKSFGRKSASASKPEFVPCPKPLAKDILHLSVSIGNTKKTSQKAEFIQILHEAGLVVAERICVRMWLWNRKILFTCRMRMVS